ncbi:MAG: hypothetical protein QM736_29805 [Vicinamibacterales bacterium]
MQRLALALVVALLTFTMCGVMSLLVHEPCSSFMSLDGDDATCPPTCATCGCCAQAVEPVTLSTSAVPQLIVWDVPDLQPGHALTTSLDILHVPRRIRA